MPWGKGEGWREERKKEERRERGEREGGEKEERIHISFKSFVPQRLQPAVRLISVEMKTNAASAIRIICCTLRKYVLFIKLDKI